MADSKLSALSQLSIPAFTDEIYCVDDPNGTPVSTALIIERLLGMGRFAPGGRLTLTTGVPITTSDVTGASTLFYTPYLHNVIRVWDGTRWVLKTFAEISLSLTLTSGKNYDVFIDDDAATLTLSSAWTNDTTRADALGTQDGVIVLSSDHTKLWLGTLRASGTNTTEDSAVNRLLVNAYNTVIRLNVKSDGTQHTYGTNSNRAWNNVASTHRIGFLVPTEEEAFGALLTGAMGNAGDGSNGRAALNANLDSDTAGDNVQIASSDPIATTMTGATVLRPGLGYHFLGVSESAPDSNTVTFFSYTLFLHRAI